MANRTNFAAMLTKQKLVWARDLWKIARNHSFVMKFTGTGPNAVIQRVTELTKRQSGVTEAVINLVTDLEGDGVTGDYELLGNEEAISAYEESIRIDQLRNANRNTGRLADQKSVIRFRETSRDVLGYWLGDRIDQLAFQTLAGVAYNFRPNLATRPSLATGRNLVDLEFATDVTAPSAARYVRWDSAGGQLMAGDTGAVTTADIPSYRMLVNLKAYAKEQYIRGIRGKGNEEFYHVFLTPTAMASLKLDSDYIANLRNGGVRGHSNPLFTGSVVTVDGLVIHEFRHVPNTSGLAAGSKWGVNDDVEGCKMLFCGAQALAMADLGTPNWEEEDFDYHNAYGIAIDKMFGLKKPRFHSPINGDVQDFGVIVCDVAQGYGVVTP